MVNGLEISEVRFNEIKKSTTFRLDSEMYQKTYIKMDNVLKDSKKEFICFEELHLRADASAFYPSLEPYYNTGDKPFIRVADIKSRVDYENCVKIPIMGKEYNTLKLCNKGDIVLTKGGTVGKVGLIEKESYVTRDLIFINSSILQPKEYVFLYILLNTNFYYNLMIKSSSYSVQPHLTITLIKELPIYKCKNNKLKEIILYWYEKYIEKNNTFKELIENCKKSIDNELLTVSNIERETLYSVEKLSTVLKSERIDAEFFDAKYKKYNENIKNYCNGFDFLKNICNLYDENFIPEKDTEYKYIELSNVSKDGCINGLEYVLGENLPTRARRKVSKGKVIVSSIEGSLNSCVIINDDDENLVCSNGFFVIDSDRINSETLFILFKSDVMQSLLKQQCTGTILTCVNKIDFNKLLIPIIRDEIQEKISLKVNKAFREYRNSEKILETLINAMEIALLKDEETAIKFIEDNCDE